LFAVASEQVRFRTRKHFALLVRLALEPGKQFTRDYLADLLWPDAPARHANHSLAQSLSVIKAKIAREAVVIQRATVGLAAGWIDVDVTHLPTGDVRIDGPFLDGFEIPDARPFEDWKGEFRARLIPQIRDCLVRQMDAARRIGDFPTVERHATRLQDLDPLAEEGIRGIMEARAWASDRSSALKAFARYEAQLANELGAKPGPELVRMADLLRDGRGAPSRPATPGYPPERADRRFEPETLIGREREFSVLYDAWLEARRKSPRIVVVTSDPGVGKTTLVNAFASSCQMEGAVVARAQAYDAERELPFAVLGELVKQLATQRAIGSADPEALSELTRISSEILRAFPGVPQPVDWSPELTPLRIATAFLKTIVAAAEDSPVLLVVDDIHATDNASTAILHLVARKLVDARVLIVLAGRSSELRLSDAPAALAFDSTIKGLTTLTLDVLPGESACRLVEQITGSADYMQSPTERILRAGGGNPLAIELLTREWIDHGAASLLRDLEALNTQPVATLGIPRAIGAVFERQSRRLDLVTKAALDLAAILGRRLCDLSLYAAVDLPPGPAAEALSRLKSEGLLREVGGDLEFRNELIRAQAYYSITSRVRQNLHARVGDLLAIRPPLIDSAVSLEIAWHYLRGDQGSIALPFAHSGAEAFLAIGAPREAEEILRAIETVKQPPAAFKKTRLFLAKALVDQSKADSALPIINRLSVDHDLTLHEQAEVAMLKASAEFLLNTEPGEKYCEAAKAAFAKANETGDPVLISRALFECARAGTEQGLTDLICFAEQGVSDLAARADVRELPMAILTRAFSRIFFLHPDEALLDLRRMVDASTTNGNAAQMSFIYSVIGNASLILCNLGEAFDAFLLAFEKSQKVGDDSRSSLLAANLCLVETMRGLHADAIAFGNKAIALGEASSSSALQMSYTNLIDAYVLAGQEAKAIQCMESARRWLIPRRRWKFHCAFLMECAAFELIRGNTSLALDLIGQLENVARGREDAVPMLGPYWKLRIFREASLGRVEEAERLVFLKQAMLQNSCPLYFLDVLAAKAWLQRRTLGQVTAETQSELDIFEVVGAAGKKAILTAQGFLSPKQACERSALVSPAGEALLGPESAVKLKNGRMSKRANADH